MEGNSSITKRSLKRLEYCRKAYFDALKTYEQDEELRLAMLNEAKVNLRKIHDWSVYMQGARRAFILYRELLDDSKGRRDNMVYTDAIHKLITSDLRYTGMFLSGDYTICYRNHQRDKKGKLISCEAFFADKVEVYRDVQI